MNATEAVTKIKLLLGLDQETTTEETVVIETETNEVVEEFTTSTLVDGTTIEVDGDFETGKSCYVVTDEEKMTMPEGKHELTDGKLITVDAAGVITEVEELEETEEEVQAEEEVKEEVEMEETEEVEAEETEEEVDMVMEIVTALKPFIDNLDELKEKVEAMEEKYESFAQAPAKKPIKKVSEDFNSNKFDRVAKIARIRK